MSAGFSDLKKYQAFSPTPRASQGRRRSCVAEEQGLFLCRAALSVHGWLSRVGAAEQGEARFESGRPAPGTARCRPQVHVLSPTRCSHHSGFLRIEIWDMKVPVRGRCASGLRCCHRRFVGLWSRTLAQAWLSLQDGPQAQSSLSSHRRDSLVCKMGANSSDCSLFAGG